MRRLTSGIKVGLEALGLRRVARETYARLRGAWSAWERANFRWAYGAAVLLGSRTDPVHEFLRRRGARAPGLSLALARGSILLRRGSLEGAEAAFRAVLHRYESDPEALGGLINVLVQQNRLAEARSLATIARTAHPSHRACIDATAFAFARSGEIREASVALEALSTRSACRVLLLHHGRSGSTVLADLFAQDPEVHWDREIYTQLHRLWNSWDNPIAFLRSRSEASTAPVYGFELKPAQVSGMGLDLQVYLHLAQRMRFDQLVYLTRRNLLRLIVSRDISRTTNVWHTRRRSAKEARHTKLDVRGGSGRTSLLSRLEALAREVSDTERALHGRRHLRLFYEDDISDDPRIGHVKLCRFVDRRPVAAVVRYQRTNPFPLRALIGNFDEVAEALRGTAFDWMLDD